MSNSPLVDYVKISPYKNSPRNHKIDTVTIHCMVAQWSPERCGEEFSSKSRRASSNYGIGPDGRIGMYVEEKDRSWCSSNAANDNRAITIEVASDTKHPYAVTDAAYKALIELLADICKRNGIKELKWKGDKNLIGQIDKQNMTVHRWFAKKACPGDYLYNRHGDIAEQVNAKLNEQTVKPEPAAPTGDVYIVKKGDTLSKIAAAHKTTVDKLVDLNNLANPDRIAIGQKLVVALSDGIYIVKKGDTLSKIAKAYKTTVAKLVDLNNLTNPNRIEIGQRIVVAETGPSEEEKLKAFVRDIQAVIGAVTDGIADQETLSKTPTLSAKTNRKHAAVKIVQKRLKELGYSEVGDADGIAGPRFTSAVAAFQQDNGCTVDGIISARNKTWKKLLGMI